MDSANPYVAFVRSWYWLIVLGVAIALAATHLAIGERPNLYRSTATLQVGRTLEDESPGQDELATTDRLVTVYGELAAREPVLDAVIDALKLNIDAAQLRARMLVEPSPSTQLIDITVLDTNPDAAAAIANEIARQLVLTSPGPTTDSRTQEFVQNQLGDLQAKIAAAQEEVADLETSMLGMTSAADVYDAQQHREALNAQIDSWQETYGVLLGQLEPSATNIVRVISEASPATAPQPQNASLYYGFAIVMGAGMASLLALGLMQLDRSLRRGEELETLGLQHPVVDIPLFRRRKTTSLVALRAPESAAASAYRELRNRLKLEVGADKPQALVITSPNVGEGKTTTAANLGISLANSGNLVFLVDANFHNPELDENFGFEAKHGFADLLLGTKKSHEVLVETEHPYLWLIGAGGIPPNYLDVLASGHVEAVIGKLLDEADFVILDGPALGQEQESQILAKAVGQVILIAESAHTTSDNLLQARDHLSGIGVNICLMVFNKVRKPMRAHVWQWPWSRERRIESKAQERRRRRMVKRAPGATVVEASATTHAD
jgi:capsular exopolysaccharide synthesis family protein